MQETPEDPSKALTEETSNHSVDRDKVCPSFSINH